MKHAAPFLCFFLLFLSCKKEEPSAIPTSATHVFFKNRTDMHQQIRSAISKRYPGESLQEISNVSYIDSRDKSYALVFYRSDKRAGNILLERTYRNGVLFAASTGTCEGASCNCQVITTISNSGTVKISCSCSSCTMLINQTVAPAAN